MRAGGRRRRRRRFRAWEMPRRKFQVTEVIRVNRPTGRSRIVGV